MFKYNPLAHIGNNHRNHSLVDAYTESGIYLGDVKELNLVTGNHFDKLERQGLQVILKSGIYVVYENNKIVQEYENVYSQNGIILGHILIKDNIMQEKVNAVDFLNDKMRTSKYSSRVGDNAIGDDLATLEIYIHEQQSIAGDVSLILKKDGRFAISNYSGNFTSAMEAIDFAKLIQLVANIAMEWEALHITKEV